MRRTPAASPGVSLFPFLAVLLCTMGALIVVLVVINRQSRLHAATRNAGAVAEANSAREDLLIQQEQLNLAVEQLSAARSKTLNDLDLARRRLSSLEDQSRKLEDELKSLSAAAGQLAGNRNDGAREALRNELAKLNTERLQLETALEKAREGAKYRKPSFSIVPFHGLYRTNRRPIYIECRANSIIIQPEGIELGPSDFLGPPGPGNPLAAALRAASEYWAQRPPETDGPNEPYPLLLVRPDGIIGYYLAREAMASWGTEFGYEMVEADWQLEFPNPPDARLVEMEQRAVAESRQRLEWLATASPDRYSRKSKTTYRASPIRGGVMRDGGPGLGNDPFADDPLGGFGRAGGSSMVPGNGGSGLGENNLAFGGNNLAAGENTGGRGQGLDNVANGGGSQGFGTGGPQQNTFGSNPGETFGGRANANPNSNFGSSTSPNGGQTFGQSSSQSSALAGNPGNASGSSTSAAGGSSASSSQISSNGQSAMGETSPVTVGTPQPSDLQPAGATQRTASCSVAQQRGRNWAAQSSSGSVPITRPIRVECFPDRLVLIPDARDQEAQVIPLGGRTQESIDQFVGAVRNHTRGWGIAGRGLYWKPQIALEVAPNATARADDLQLLMADSGIDVKRK